MELVKCNVYGLGMELLSDRAFIKDRLPLKKEPSNESDDLKRAAVLSSALTVTEGENTNAQ